jgi:molecular chaperone GrpE
MDDIEQLKKELEDQTHKAEERLNQLKYLQADFDNFRKRCEKEKDLTTEMANERLVKDLLVILDDFEQALPSLDQEKNKEGMEMIYQKIVKILSSYGLQPIDCEGKKFDPHFHEVLCTEKCSGEQNIVLAELGKGYCLKSRVIRPSRVKIAEHVVEDTGENNG